MPNIYVYLHRHSWKMLRHACFFYFPKIAFFLLNVWSLSLYINKLFLDTAYFYIHQVS